LPSILLRLKEINVNTSSRVGALLT